jgi:hypothetical protein
MLLLERPPIIPIHLRVDVRPEALPIQPTLIAQQNRNSKVIIIPVARRLNKLARAIAQTPRRRVQVPGRSGDELEERPAEGAGGGEG